MAKLGDLDKPLTKQILSDPQNAITKHLLYIYSMESFVYEDLNRASREKDKSKIKFYAAYAAALSYVIYSANRNRRDQKLSGTTVLFRGIKLQSEAELETFKEGATKHLLGYTSTTKSFDVAKKFALSGLLPGQIPLVLQITFHGKKGLFHMS